MKRFYTILIIVFGVYACAMSLYLLKGDLFQIPHTLTGTIADPHTFMTNQEIEKSESLSRIRSLAFFVSSPMQMGLLVVLLGSAVRIRNGTERWFHRSWLQTIAFLLIFTLLMDVLFLPIDFFLFRVDHAYGISNETLAMFWGDHGKDFLINGLGTIVMVGLFRWVIRRSPGSWWLWFWLASIPLILFVTFIQPVVLDPLYNDFKPLQNQELKAQILHLAAQSHIPTDQVYEVNMSERTNAINAYVNGIGGNARIVLWDTILKKLQSREILTVMAHEMGHYIEKHIYWGIAYGVLLSFVGLWLTFHAYRFFITRWGSLWGIRGERDLAALPVLLLIVTWMNFASAPVQNVFSRILEHRADIYSMKMTGDGNSAIQAFQKIAKENLSPVTQPKLVQWFRGSHPTIIQRIEYFKQFSK
ncbi:MULTISPECIES: M48 family metallopeptidase [unclassified Paenibacillus]|uniref:M48 family metallopeptidase n=1 Tax=unclassified Paenibacillus TaxID=185978 RepID=UPI002786EE03|nr:MULTISPECIES: M48 family metallopeptidase [unclassified Paenibacillus]MDQ0903765.1 STE24 endopeptidase [Paenibacillus sp. V4I7]MDQ0917761.1 STE24 endopeptidase [Paenibacillus sp. V4I5]